MELKWTLVCLLLQFHSIVGNNNLPDSKCELNSDDPLILENPACDQVKFCAERGSKFGPEMKKCIRDLGRTCSDTLKYYSCPKNAICNHNYCSCQHLFFKTPEGTCEKGKFYREDCSLTDTPPNMCQVGVGLSCQNGQCDCKEDAFWSNETSNCLAQSCEDRIKGRESEIFLDPGTQECKLKLTRPNDSSQNRHTVDLKMLNNNLISCPNNSSLRTDYGNIGYCRCNENFEASQDRQTCQLQKVYGEECSVVSEEIKSSCNYKMGFFCRDGICKCRDGATYNPTDSLCYSQTDCEQRNYNTFHEGNETECHYYVGSRCDMNSNASNLSCPLNTICKENDYHYHYYGEVSCACTDGFTTSANKKKCIEIKNYGEDCSIQDGDPCSPMSRSTCSTNGKCDCKENQIWSPISQQCGLKESASCEDDEFCSRHANCKWLSRYSSYCRCNEGYSPKDGHCLANYLTNCEDDLDCHEGTLCMDGVCKCPDLRHQIYDQIQNSCVGLAGSPCSTNAENFCSRNSSCSEGVCKCGLGFHQTPKGNCAKFLEHGEECKFGQCDFRKGLACITGACSCIDPSMTVTAEEVCVAAVGEECGLLEPVGKCSLDYTSHQCDSYMVNCDASAHCQHIGNGVSRCELSSAPSISNAD